VAELILLNGPPASGKSTLAQRYVDDHPLALNLDIDRIRSMLGRWADHAFEAGLAARALALGLASTHLRAGHDVIIPQHLGRLAFIEQLEQLAVAEGVRLHELVLLDSLANMLRRFADRTAAAAEPAHVEADASLRAWGGPAGLVEMYDRLLDVIEQRPNTQVIPSEYGQPDRTYELLLAALDCSAS
jgi:predicted kinase